MLGRALLPVNWLQIMENSLDPIHTEWLHGHTYEFHKEQEGVKVAISARHEKIAFREFEFGITKHRLLAGHSEDGDDWKIGHPIVFPNILSVGNGDEARATTRSRSACRSTTPTRCTSGTPPTCRRRARRCPPHLLDKVHVYDVPFRDADGEFIMDNIDGQDMMVWITQGAIADRTRENLGASDKGIAIYRRVLRREIKKVEEGIDPIGVRPRPGAQSAASTCRTRRKKHHNSDGFASCMLRTHAKYSPIADDLVRIFEGRPSGTTR